MPKDLRDSIKGERTSHLSSPVGNDTEFHLRLEELSIQPKQKGRYYLCFPVECVSDAEKGKTSNGEDKDMARFVQMGKPDLKEISLDQKLNRVGSHMAQRMK